MRPAVYDNRVSEAIEEIYRDMFPKPVKWYHIGYHEPLRIPMTSNYTGRKVFMTESALRRCDIDVLCSDPSLQPVRHRRSRGYRPNRQPPLSESMWYMLLVWLGQSLLEIFAGQRN